MITLSLLKHLENQGIGTIDADLFWQKLTLDKTGLYITSAGNATDRGSRKRQTYTLYARGTSDVEGLKLLQRALDILNSSYELCDLPAVADITDGFHNVTILPTSTPSNNGLDAHDRIIWSASGDIIY